PEDDVDAGRLGGAQGRCGDEQGDEGDEGAAHGEPPGGSQGAGPVMRWLRTNSIRTIQTTIAWPTACQKWNSSSSHRTRTQTTRCSRLRATLAMNQPKRKRPVLPSCPSTMTRPLASLYSSGCSWAPPMVSTLRVLNLPSASRSGRKTT